MSPRNAIPDVWTMDETIPTDGISFADALEQTSFGKFNWLLLILSGVVFTNVAFETAGTGFILPILQCDLDLTTQQKGIISACSYAGIIVSSHLWGFLADTKGRKAVILPSLLIGYGMTVCSSFAPTFWFLVVFRFLNGFFLSCASSTIHAYLGEFHTDRKRSQVMMICSFIYAAGSVGLPAIAYSIINQEWSLDLPFLGITYKPWRLYLIVCGIPGLICGLAIIALPESPKFLLSVGKVEEALTVLKKMYALNTGKDVSDFKAAKILPDDEINERVVVDPNSNAVIFFLRTMWYQTAPLFQTKYIRTTLIVCTIQFWIFVTSSGMYMWLPDILNRVVEYIDKNPDNPTYICDMVAKGNVSEKATCTQQLEVPTYLYSLLLDVLFTAIFALIGFVINFIGKVPILFSILTTFGSCGIAVIFVNIPTLAIIIYIFQFMCVVGINVLAAATVDLYPTHLRAMAVCISLMVGRLGGMAGANAVGVLLENHCNQIFWITGFGLIASGFLVFLIPKRTTGA